MLGFRPQIFFKQGKKWSPLWLSSVVDCSRKMFALKKLSDIHQEILEELWLLFYSEWPIPYRLTKSL